MLVAKNHPLRQKGELLAEGRVGVRTLTPFIAHMIILSTVRDCNLKMDKKIGFYRPMIGLV